LPAIPLEALSREESDSVSNALVWLAVRQASLARVNPPHSTVIRTPTTVADPRPRPRPLPAICG
jgi:hypothetical protein